jgi:hypothetical protein
MRICAPVVGVIGNAAIVIYTVTHGLYRNHTFFFIANLALSDFLKADGFFPITLANLLLQNVIFGSFMCYVLPMMHSFPIHASMLTYIMLAADR